MHLFQALTFSSRLTPMKTVGGRALFFAVRTSHRLYARRVLLICVLHSKKGGSFGYAHPCMSFPPSKPSLFDFFDDLLNNDLAPEFDRDEASSGAPPPTADHFLVALRFRLRSPSMPSTPVTTHYPAGSSLRSSPSNRCELVIRLSL